MFPWEMDVGGESSGTLGQMDDLEKCSSQNESCGICRDIIIDRGVLDCCSHWFCYTCIDNWAAITNRCPLCKSEFQHITCTPVYGTIGAVDEDEYSLTSCDDDWYVQEESSTLSFPSYYIDAEAVVCLDDGDCKIRNGLVAAEDDSSLDTSIACDSCDKWYHAICVGFNTAMASDNSWLCPRCKFNEVEHEADVILKQNFSEECVIGSDRTGTNASFSGRVSVSVADEGETALVVSMVGVHSETRGGLSEASQSLKTAHETFNCSSYPSHSKDALVADASYLQDTDIFSRPQNKPSEINVVHTHYSEPTETSLQFSPIREPAVTIFSSEQGNMSTERLEVPKLVSSCPVVGNSTEVKSTGEENAVEQSNNKLSPVMKSPQPFSSDAVQQMKTAQNLQLPLRHDGHNSDDMKEEEDMESGNEVIHPAKKAKLEVQEQDINVIGNSAFSSTYSHHTTSRAKATDDDMSESVAQQKSIPDIMSIVEGDVYRRDPGRELAKPVGRRAGDKAGPRVKKIFRKEEGKESSAMVQKLQKEIREVVRDTGTNILEKDGSFDEKLLTAFRAAIGKSVDGPAKGTNTNQLMGTRRSLLQKGKKRENLTKKLYGTSTGRRRSDWHRDWEVEFWKYRCSPGINPEKIETLQSVLQLLKKSSEMDKESAKGKREENNNNSILSRLYLADASVVPRKDDIRPLSALAGCAPLEKSSQIKANGNKYFNVPAAGTETMKISSPSSTEKAPSFSGDKEASSRRENRNSQPSQDERNQSSGDIKQDKRKWALEILARKNASSVRSKDQTGGTDTLKANFPLLAQLPMDMRPQLAAGSNKKVPVSVRQAQLHRIAEHYLRKANLDVIRRCADTELAIADAVNVEKGIYERSNSKSIYVNLCSQATRQDAKAKSDNGASSLTRRTESGSDQISQEVTSEDTNVSSDVEEDLNRAAVSDQKSELGDDTAPEHTVHKDTVSFSSAEDALRKAGLFYSPPNSPDRGTMEVEGNSDSTAPEHTVHKDTVSFSSAEDALRKAGLFDSPPNSPDRGTMEVEGESRQEKPSKNLLSNPEDVSSLKDDNSLLPTDLDAANCHSLDPMCQQPECNSEDQQKLTGKGENEDVVANKTNAANLTEADRCSEQCEKSSGPGKVSGHAEASREMEKAANNSPNQSCEDGLTTDGEVIIKPKNSEPSKEKSRSDKPSVNSKDPKADKSKHAGEGGDDLKKRAPDQAGKNTPDASSSTYKKVEMFVKEQIRSLCKSGVITVDQYKWAVVKTTDKVMSFHRDAKNANFLIKEGDKVKKLALQYVEASQQKLS